MCHPNCSSGQWSTHVYIRTMTMPLAIEDQTLHLASSFALFMQPRFGKLTQSDKPILNFKPAAHLIFVQSQCNGAVHITWPWMACEWAKHSVHNLESLFEKIIPSDEDTVEFICFRCAIISVISYAGASSSWASSNVPMFMGIEVQLLWSERLTG